MYLLIDFFGSEPLIVTNQEGETEWFETKEEAIEYADRNLQKTFWGIFERTE